MELIEALAVDRHLAAKTRHDIVISKEDADVWRAAKEAIDRYALFAIAAHKGIIADFEKKLADFRAATKREENAG